MNNGKTGEIAFSRELGFQFTIREFDDRNLLTDYQ